jgi:ATP-binding cassette subfamily B protein
MHDVRTDSFRRMQRLDMSFFDDKQTGEVMSVLNNDASNLEVFLDNALHNSARLVVMVAGIAAILFWSNWQLALLTLVAVPAMVALTYWFVVRVAPRYAAQREAVGDFNTRIENTIGGVELVKTSGTESYEVDRVRSSSLTLFRRTMEMLRLSYVYRPGMELLAGLSFAVTFVVGGWWLLNGPPPLFSTELSSGEFVTFLFLSQRFVTPLAEVSNIVDQFQNAKASSERVFGLMSIPPAVTEAPDAVELDDPEGHVEYDDVVFGYGVEREEAAGSAGAGGTTAVDGGTGRAGAGGDAVGRDTGIDTDTDTAADDGGRVVDGVSFEAEPGETVALVGATGAGKSTLLKLLLRLYDVDGGAVRVDGHDVRDLTLSSLRGAVGYVSQDTFLFDGTVADNVRYGEFEATDGEVVEAAEAAEAHGFVTDLEDGYGTRVGERGVKLSGGQRQRLSIARAILQDPEILVLDEATSDVDTETELAIQRSLDRLTEGRTTLVVAHRLSTVRDADTILVLEDGRIVERGDHGDLLDAGGRYADLWGVQAGVADAIGAGED